MVLVFHDPSGDVTQAAGIQDSLQAALKVNPDARVSSYFNTGADSGLYVSKDGHTMFAVMYPAGENGFGSGGTIAATQQAIAEKRPGGRGGIGHRPGRVAAGRRRGRQRRPQHSGRGRDRCAGRADHPAVRVRDAARGGDAADRRDGVDPQHLHADLASDLRHRRVGDRGVPGGAGRPRRRDRLLAALHLPIPRGAGGGQVVRRRAGRDHDPRRASRWWCRVRPSASACSAW